MMISAISEPCTVRWAEVNRKVYRFQSLVFKEGEESEAKASNDKEQKPVTPPPSPTPCEEREVEQAVPDENNTISPETLKSILTTTNNTPQDASPTGTPAYGGSLGSNLVSTKRIRIASSEEEDGARRSTRRVHFSEEIEDEESVSDEAPDEDEIFDSTCSSCQQPSATSDRTSYQELMEKSKEELANMVVNLNLSLEQTRQQIENAKDEGTSSSETATQLTTPSNIGKLKKLKSRSKSSRKKRLITL